MRDHRGKVAVATLVAVLLLTSIAFGLAALTLAAGPAAGGTRSDDTLTNVTAFHWQAPDDFEGDLAIGLQIRASETTWCEWTTHVEGRVVDDWPPILHWENDGAGAHGSHNARQPIRAHAAGQIDTRPVVGATTKGTWDDGMVGGRMLEERHGLAVNLTEIGFGVRNVSDGQERPPWEIDLSCENPVDLGLSAGRTAIPISATSMTDGGAGVSGGSPATRHVTVQRDAETTGTFDASQVRFEAHWRTHDDTGRVGSAADGPAQLTLHHPDGARSWALPAPQDRDGSVRQNMAWDGGPGDYRVELDMRRANPDGGHFLGAVLFGIDPVDSLDEAV